MKSGTDVNIKNTLSRRWHAESGMVDDP